MKPIELIRQENLRFLANELGGVSKLANKIGKSQAQVSQWLNGSKLPSGKPRSIRSESAREIENILGLDQNWIDSPKDVVYESVNTSPVEPVKGYIPLLSSVRAGTWGEIDNHHADTDELIAVRETDPGEHAFALRVEGDSMTWDGSPSFPEGTVLIVSVQRAPKAGDYVIAKNTTGQKALFKKLMTDGMTWQLNSLNRDYKPIPIEDPAVRVIGVVVEYWMGGKL
jgi:SOS-response transcriptional repressor LexA